MSSVKKKRVSRNVELRPGLVSTYRTEFRAAHGSDNFFEKVWKVVRKIPYGRVTSYGAIANFLGSGLSSRMVGWAMNKAGAAAMPVPAHRVVNRNGVLTGKHYFGSPDLMQQLLEHENISVINDTVMNFENVFWDPCKELNK